MKVIIDELSNIDGWVYTGTGTAEIDNHKNYSANESGKQLLIKYNPGDLLEKTYTESINISETDNILFNIIGKQKSNIDGFKGKIKFIDSLGNEIEYYLEYSTNFEPSIYKNTLTDIKTIIFTFTSTDEIMISDIIAVKDEFPIDIYKAIKEKIESFSDEYKILVGYVTCSAGDKNINIPDLKYCDKYTVIKIGEEYHQIKSEVITENIQFYSNYSGSSILLDYSNEPVYLVVPIRIETDIIEPSVPSISLSGGFNSEQLSYEKFSYYTDSYTESGTYRIVNIGSSNKFIINMTGYARNKKSLQLLFDIIRRFINDKDIMLFINGRKSEFYANNINTIDTTQLNELLSTISTDIELDITEESYENPDALEIDNTINIGVI